MGKTMLSQSEGSQLDTYADFAVVRLKPSLLPKIKLRACEEYQFWDKMSIETFPTIWKAVLEQICILNCHTLMQHTNQYYCH